jgi:hypothetical protein
MMKKIICFLIFVTNGFILQINSQNTNTNCPSPTVPGWFDQDWDWTISTNSSSDPNRWIARVASGAITVTLGVNSPFVNGGTNEVNDLVYTQDYKPNQGWTLLFKDFGYTDPLNLNHIAAKNDIPTFILYNKYRSLIRVFMYANGTSIANFNYAYINAEWQSPNVSAYNNGLLTMGRANSLPNIAYTNNTNNSDKISSHINDYAHHQWFVAEFPVTFDPNTSQQVYGERLNFIFRGGIVSNIALEGNFTFSTKSSIAKDPPPAVPNTVNNNPVYDFVNSAKEFLGKVPTRTELSANFNQMATASASLNSAFDNKFTNNIADLNYNLQNGDLKKYLLGAADLASDAGGAVGLVATVLKTFIGKGDPALANDNQKYIEPTISSGFLTLGGTITTEVTGKILDFQLPGTKHQDAAGCDTYLGMPYYDCPLGVIALQETPILNKKKFLVPKQEAHLHASIDFVVPSLFLGGNCDPSLANNVTVLQDIFVANTNILLGKKMQRSEDFYLMYDSMAVNSFQIDGKVKLAFNEIAGVEIISTKAALYFEVDKKSNDTPAFDLLPYSPAPELNFNNSDPNYISYQIDALFSLTQPLGGAQCFAPIVFSNFTTSNFAQSIVVTKPYKNLTVDLLNKEVLDLATVNRNGRHSFQTPFIDLDKFDGTSITIQDSATPYIKILVTMMPTDPTADQTPITYVMTYEIPSNKINNINGGSTIVEYPMTCEQRINDVTGITKIPGVGTINSPVTQDLAIILGDSSGNLLSTNTTSNNLIVKADNYITVKSTVTATASANGFVKLQVAPTGACVAGRDAKLITGSFANCNSNPFVRIIRHLEQDSVKISNPWESANENVFDNEVYLYPNPNSGNFTLYVKNEVILGRVIITNELGIIVFESEIKNSSKIDFDLIGLSRGIYFLKLATDAKIKPIKFIVE